METRGNRRGAIFWRKNEGRMAVDKAVRRWVHRAPRRKAEKAVDEAGGERYDQARQW